MNYDYKIVNIDPSLAFTRRVLLYIALLLATVALALIVLFILFERYWMLFLPGGIIIFAASILFLTARKTSVYQYSLSDKSLKVSGGRFEQVFLLENLSIIKNAEKSDYIDKAIIKLSFSNRRIVLKSAVTDNSFCFVDYVVSYENKQYLISLDDYALATVKGEKDE